MSQVSLETLLRIATESPQTFSDRKLVNCLLDCSRLNTAALQEQYLD